jgi:hypothetical protein
MKSICISADHKGRITLFACIKKEPRTKERRKRVEEPFTEGTRQIFPPSARITPFAISGKRAFALRLRLIIRCRARPLRNLFLFQMSGEGRKSSYATSDECSMEMIPCHAATPSIFRPLLISANKFDAEKLIFSARAA